MKPAFVQLKQAETPDQGQDIWNPDTDGRQQQGTQKNAGGHLQGLSAMDNGRTSILTIKGATGDSESCQLPAFRPVQSKPGSMRDDQELLADRAGAQFLSMDVAAQAHILVHYFRDHLEKKFGTVDAISGAEVLKTYAVGLKTDDWSLVPRIPLPGVPDGLRVFVRESNPALQDALKHELARFASEHGTTLDAMADMKDMTHGSWRLCRETTEGQTGQGTKTGPFNPLSHCDRGVDTKEVAKKEGAKQALETSCIEGRINELTLNDGSLISSIGFESLRDYLDDFHGDFPDKELARSLVSYLSHQACGKSGSIPKDIGDAAFLRLLSAAVVHNLRKPNPEKLTEIIQAIPAINLRIDWNLRDALAGRSTPGLLKALDHELTALAGPHGDIEAMPSMSDEQIIAQIAPQTRQQVQIETLPRYAVESLTDTWKALTANSSDGIYFKNGTNTESTKSFVVKCGPLLFDLDRHQVYYGDEPAFSITLLKKDDTRRDLLDNYAHERKPLGAIDVAPFDTGKAGRIVDKICGSFTWASEFSLRRGGEPKIDRGALRAVLGKLAQRQEVPQQEIEDAMAKFNSENQRVLDSYKLLKKRRE